MTPVVPKQVAPPAPPVKVVPKKTDLEIGLEKILGGESEAAPLKELLSKITKEA